MYNFKMASILMFKQTWWGNGKNNTTLNDIFFKHFTSNLFTPKKLKSDKN